MPSLKEILAEIEHLELVGDEDAVCEQVVPLGSGPYPVTALMWCAPKHTSKLREVTAGTVIVSSETDRALFSPSCNYILTDNPRRTFMEILERFFAPPAPEGVQPTAFIHETVRMGAGGYIGRNVVVERDCVLGDFVRIDANTVVKRGTVMGDRVSIGSNCTIGGAGFGYERNREGQYRPIPHIGNVVLEDDVCIGENSCIDRAVMGSTLLERNVKIDNLVHIAHGVRIGANSVVTANVMVAGSATVGEDSWLGPSTSIMNGIEVGPETFTGLGAVVIKSLEGGDVVAGNPAKRLRKNES